MKDWAPSMGRFYDPRQRASLGRRGLGMGNSSALGQRREGSPTPARQAVAGSGPTSAARVGHAIVRLFGTLSGAGLPRGSVNMNWFSLFNAVSWQIALGAPVILYAQKLGADDALLGLLGALQPLLAPLQVPGAHLLPRLGYRRAMVLGWGARTAMLFVLASAPLWLASSSSRLAAILVCLVLFNLFTGLASGAWMPWQMELIPHAARGRFFSQQQIFAMFGGLVALGMAALLLLGRPGVGQFSLTLLLSAVGGAVAVLFLASAPDPSAPQARRRAGVRVPWLAMTRFAPFQRLCIFNMLFTLVLGGLGVFTVAFLRGVEGFGESSVVVLSALGVVGGLLSLLWSGLLMDRLPARLIIRSAVLVMALACAGWCMVAGRIVPCSPPLVGALYLFSGIAGVHATVANLRLQAAVIPAMGRNHFFALFGLVTSLAAAGSPLAWGLLLNALGAAHVYTGPLLWSRYTICFAGATALVFGVFWYCRRLIEAPWPVAETAVTPGNAPAVGRRPFRPVEYGG